MGGWEKEDALFANCFWLTTALLDFERVKSGCEGGRNWPGLPSGYPGKFGSAAPYDGPL